MKTLLLFAIQLHIPGNHVASIQESELNSAHSARLFARYDALRSVHWMVVGYTPSPWDANETPLLYTWSMQTL